MTTPQFTQPGRPDHGPILQMHRRHDGWISFHRKNPGTGQHEDLFSVKARDLDNFFPSMSPLLERDAYFSVNAYYRAGHGFARNSPKDLDLPRAKRGTDALRWLTCCFADIDCHTLGVSTGQAIGAIVDAQDQGRIPPASMLTRSGRGVWVFWFLVDDQDDHKPVRAWPENVRLYVNVQNRIGKEFAAIGADALARDAIRITRVPGSINTKSRRRVDYWIQGDHEGNRFAYRLADLATSLQVRVPKRTPKLDRQVDFLTKRAKSGWRKRWLNARQDFERLWELRGTFAPGTRNAAVFLYVTFLRGLRLDQDGVVSEAWRLFRCLDQPKADPFEKDDLLSAVKGAKGASNISNQKIADMLRITPDEANVLKRWPPASCHGGQPDEPAIPQAERTRRRRALLQAKVRTLTTWPGLKALAKWLTDQGCECTFRTVKRDLEELGIPNPQAKPRRSRRKSESDLF